MPPTDLPPELDDVHTAERRAKFPDFYKYEHMMRDGTLADYELFWRDHYTWLKESGYLLRPRYSPDWSAPWKDTDEDPSDFEDSVLPPVRAFVITGAFLKTPVL
jgi:hypothetical protein